MSTNFPVSVDTSVTLPAEGASTPLSTSHVTAHQNLQDAVEAIEAKIGVDSSAVTTSHDYKLSAVTGSNKAVPNNGATIATPTITGATITTSTVNGVTLQTTGSATDFLAANGSYVNGAVTNASTTIKGISELATSAEITAGTATGGTGAALVVTPDQLASSAPTFSGANLTSLPLNIYTTSSSANQKLAADNTSATISGVAAPGTKVKEIIVNYGGVISLYYEAQGNGVGTTTSQPSVNGTLVGTQRTPLTNGSYTAYTEDITVNAGDRVQLNISGAGGGTATAKNFRIRYDKTISNEGLVVTN